MNTVKFNVKNDWGAGFTGEIVITNVGNQPLQKWQVEFDAPFTISNLWNGQITRSQNGHYVVSNASWNGAIAPGASVSFGFNGNNPNGTTRPPANLQLVGGSSSGGQTSAPPPVISVADVLMPEGNSDSNAQFRVQLSAASDRPVTVNYGTQNGSARAGEDYIATSGTLTFAPGETSKQIGVRVKGDRLVEGDETFGLKLSAPTNGTLGDGNATATLRNDDQPPVVSAPPPPAASPAPKSAVLFEVENDYGRDFKAKVTIRNTGTTPLNGWELGFDGNYSITQIWNGSLSQPTSGEFSVAPVGWNKVIAPGQSVAFGFMGRKRNGAQPVTRNFELNGLALNGGTGQPPAPLPTISINDVTATEGIDDFALNPAEDVGFRVRLSAASQQPVTVSYATQNGTATAGQDYTAKQGTLTFAPGETEKFIGVAIADDSTTESSETFKLNLSGAVGATLKDAQGQGTILDNDPAAPPPPQNPIPDLQPDAPNGTPSTGKFNYGEALQKSFLFYEAQRSGPLPADNRIDWRGDSAVKDGAQVGRDLSGGYYDAGDHVKFGLPMAYTMTTLSWGVEEYRDAYSKVGQLDEALEAIKWGTDYILKAHVTDAQGTKEFWGQVGDGNLDHSYWGSPEAMTMARPAFKIDRQHPGTELAAEASAALSAASIIFRPTDKAYADKLLTNAQQLYDFADQYRGKYSDSMPQASPFYTSYSGYQDELSWGAIWLHDALEAKGVNESTYLNKAKAAYSSLGNWTQGWDNKTYGAAVKLAQDTGDSRYRADVEKWLDGWTSGSTVKYTQGGLAWLTNWASLSAASSTAFLAGVYGDTVNDPGGRYSDFATRQINYILGDNPRNFSYMVGFGDQYALQPHHRAASGTNNVGDPAPNDHILYGALVGGPSSPDDFGYRDVRSDYVANEVALDYNSGFTGALARMVDVFGGTPLSNAQLDALPGVTVTDMG